jgi:site-specific recombinase XerD
MLEKMGNVETLSRGLALLETIGMPARNLSARTRKEYQNDLADLIAYLAERGVTYADQVDLQALESYQAEIDRRGYAASTRQRKTYAIKTFFRFLHHHGVIAANVASQLVSPRPQKRESPLPSNYTRL